jgi:hypothetical protein
VSVCITSGGELMSGQQQGEKVHFKALHPPKVTRVAMATAYNQSIHVCSLCAATVGALGAAGVVWRELFFDDGEGCSEQSDSNCVFDECV